jgi:MFS-type transporter involved in bile tolerance (Atg22 family)
VLLVLAWFAQPGVVGVWALFVAYSATLAVTEPAERSLIGDRAQQRERGTAYGLYHLAGGLLVLPGAVVFGTLWERFDSATAFATAALITAMAAASLLLLARNRPRGDDGSG